MGTGLGGYGESDGTGLGGGFTGGTDSGGGFNYGFDGMGTTPGLSVGYDLRLIESVQNYLPAFTSDELTLINKSRIEAAKKERDKQR